MFAGPDGEQILPFMASAYLDSADLSVYKGRGSKGSVEKVACDRLRSALETSTGSAGRMEDRKRACEIIRDSEPFVVFKHN